MKFGSVCSGIEAASVAWHPLGWKAAWLSEIEPFPSAVLKHHYPDVLNLGDMTLLPERILSGEVEAPDLFCGGTPCQAFSVAGLRKSLDDARGNLSLTFCEIANAIDEMRSVRGLDQSIVFWENVPGVLNTKDNAFGCFLGALAGEDDALIPPGGRWTNAGFIDGPQRAVAWRVLDAQYFGVAQRRRRVFVVASARTDFDPAAVLFEFQGVRRDTAPSREKGKDSAKCLTARAGNGGGFDLDTETPVIANTIAARTIDALDVQSGTFIPSKQWPADIASTLDTHFGDKQGLEDQHVNAGCPLFVPVQPIPINSMNALRDADAAASTGCGIGEEGEAMYTLTKGHSHAVAFSDVSPTLKRDYGKGYGDGEMDAGGLLQTAMQVRRLTPVECERLQGFPDNYTNIKDKCPDGPRYKALGNSWAVPVVRWIGERIANEVA
jgi:DNA (cytosine-5)-methyltransferase 1